MTTVSAKMLAAARMAGRGMVDLLLPAICPSCRQADISAAGLCDECNVKLLSLVALPYCPRCASTLGPNVPARDDGCNECPTPLPRYATAVRLGPYADPLRQAVRDLKYHQSDVTLGRISQMLAQAVAGSEIDRLDFIVPVPAHWRRRVGRGVDHSAALARAIAGNLNLPVDAELTRIRHTPPQTHLSRTRRLANVRNAFAAPHPRAIAGARILLVDDVTTTGATVNEAARTLLKAGAYSVSVAVLAKSEPPTAYAEHFTDAP